MLAPSALAFHIVPRPLGTDGRMDTLSAERKSVDGNFVSRMDIGNVIG